MDFLKIVLGIAALAVAWAVVFRSKLIFSFNSWVRDRIFSDQLVLFSGRRMAILLVVLGGVALFSGLEGIIDVQTIKPNIAHSMLEQAKNDFRQGKHSRVISRCKELLRSDSKNKEAWELLATACWAIGDKELARQAVESLVRIDPEHPLGKGTFWQDEKQLKSGAH